MDNLQASDAMICNTRALAWFEHKKSSDISFMYVVNPNLIQYPIHDIDEDSKYRVGLGKLETCVAVAPDTCDNSLWKCKGYECMPTSDSSFDDFLMIPCPVNTFDNNIACDEEKCCSKRHQLFMNITKSKEYYE